MAGPKVKTITNRQCIDIDDIVCLDLMSICLDLFCCPFQVFHELLTHSNFCYSLSVLGWHQGWWIGNASKVCWFGNPWICKVGSIKSYQTTKVCMNPPSSSIWFAAMRQSALVTKAPGSVEASRERNVFGEFVLGFFFGIWEENLRTT